MLTLVNLDHYCVVVTQWQDRMTQALAKGVRRRRVERRMSTQQLADKTAELGMAIRRSVLANLENGRRGSVSIDELLILAAALDAAPMDLLYPVGLEEQIEMLPGRTMDSVGIVSWFCGDLKLDLTDESTALRKPGAGDESNIFLIRYHYRLIDRLHEHEAEAARAAAEAAAAAEVAALRAELAAVQAEAASTAAAGARAEAAIAASDTAKETASTANKEAGYRQDRLTEWTSFIDEPLRRTRAEMRRRGMLLPPVPPYLGLDLEDEDTGPASGEDIYVPAGAGNGG